MRYLTYLVKEGDRWDTISAIFYGDPYLYPLIIQANPQFLGKPYPPVGAKLQIPIIEEEPEEDIKAPWQTD